MNLFEFLMILLSLIVGLGMAEILSGIARFLKSGGAHKIPWIHGAAATAVFLGLLQTFWESWGLRTIEIWSFPAMLLMLGSPISLYLMAYVLFPERDTVADLDDYYLKRARLIWPLAGLTVIVGTLFRPVAFGDPLWVVDNASGIPILVVCAILTFTKARIAHQILVPIVLASVLLDTLTFSHSIG
jgi:hypothetical protein